MEKQKLELNAIPGGITAYLGKFNITGSYIVNGFIELELSVKNYLMSVTNEEKLNASLKMVMFDKDINSSIKELSNVDKKKVQLAYALCKKEKYIFLEYFDKGLTTKEKNYFKKLFKKIKEYQMSIMIHTNDINFLVDSVDRVCLVKDDSIVFILSRNDWYNDNLYEYIDEPEIVRFIKYCQSLNINIENYVDNKEVIKAIFRMVS